MAEQNSEHQAILDKIDIVEHIVEKESNDVGL